MALQFKISLNNTQPEVWRRIQILEGASLRTLHYAIQDVFWWRGTHSYIFNVGDEKYADPEYDYEFEGWLDDSKIKISRIVEKHSEFEFIYDFGDWWSHKVIFEGAVNADLKEKYPVCIGGKYAAPPEDCGGPPGFEEFRTVIANPKSSKHKELAEASELFFEFRL
ncbi:MAG: plasmid pRiA4b ORF-3 family protein [Bdellovibrionaceae bacterium]|nr:plasmid pRiA4b ORF-3 family protein [Pseudobdellovibrionaceae bacterium]